MGDRSDTEGGGSKKEETKNIHDRAKATTGNQVSWESDLFVGVASWL